MQRSKSRQLKLTLKQVEKKKNKLYNRIVRLQKNYSQLVAYGEQLMKEIEEAKTKTSIEAALNVQKSTTQENSCGL